jgi:copper(I)-binding protein
MHSRIILAIVLIATLSLSFTGCGAGPAGPQISVEDTWARPAPITGGNAGMFMRLVNKGGQADRLVGGASLVAAAVEVHKTTMVDGVMKMERIPGIEVPAKGQVELKPGDLHVMLIDLNQPLAAGDRVPITLRFEKSGEMKLEVEVRGP